jgi:hypothetical protein
LSVPLGVIFEDPAIAEGPARKARPVKAPLAPLDQRRCEFHAHVQIRERDGPHPRRTLLSAGKIIDPLDSSKPNPWKNFFIDKAIKEAASILERID